MFFFRISLVFCGLMVSLIASQSFAQTNIFRLDSLTNGGVLLDRGWKFRGGDPKVVDPPVGDPPVGNSPEWSKTDLDDRNWENVDPTRQLDALPQIRRNPVGWFRIRFRLSDDFYGLGLILLSGGPHINRYGSFHTICFPNNWRKKDLSVH